MSTFRKFPVRKGAILFSAGQTAYEFVMELEPGNHGETLLLARKRGARGLEGDVILKCVHVPEAPADGVTRAAIRLAEEVRLSTYLRHPGIARAHGIQWVEGTLYVIIECVAGNSLNTLLSVVPERITRFSEAFILYVGAEVARALHHAHTRTDENGQPLGIIHRAVDLDRIWLSWGGHVKLTDFGLALSKLSGRIASTVLRPHGNAYYASPEALLGLPVDARSDLFQLGLTLYELATGSHPLDPSDALPGEVAENLSAREQARIAEAVAAAKEVGLGDDAVEQLILRAATYTSRDVEHLAATLPHPLKQPLHKLLQRNPAERHQTAAELEAELRAHLDRLGTYGPKEAAEEISHVLTAAGEQLVGLVGGSVLERRQRSRDENSTQP
jgi:serine/threonine protein kinase